MTAIEFKVKGQGYSNLSCDGHH